jgi:uncharacterized membrane protein
MVLHHGGPFALFPYRSATCSRHLRNIYVLLSGFWVQSIPWMIGVFCAACVAVGITLAVLSHHVFDSRTTSALVVRIVGIVIIVAGFLLPLVLITCCAWWKTPPRQSFYYDSLLDTMLAGGSIAFKVWSPSSL